MENQPIMQPEISKKFPMSVAILITVVLTAVIVGGGVYFWQNMQLEEPETTTPEVISDQNTIVKPIVTSPLSGATIEKASDGVKITGKAAPNTYVWLFQVSEMDPNCLDMGLDLEGANRVDASGNFEIIYAPYGKEESWPREFAVVSIDPNQKYKLSWLNNTFCAPDEAKSDYFQLILKSTAPEAAAPQPETYTNQAYGFSLTFLSSWGKISAQNVTDTGSSKMRGIRLSSANDANRYIQINIARIEDKNSLIDYPQTFIKDGTLWSFYYISGGDCAGMPGCEGQESEDILAEARQIVQTFILK
jgi:hypothetical protein